MLFVDLVLIFVKDKVVGIKLLCKENVLKLIIKGNILLDKFKFGIELIVLDVDLYDVYYENEKWKVV